MLSVCRTWQLHTTIAASRTSVPVRVVPGEGAARGGRGGVVREVPSGPEVASQCPCVASPGPEFLAAVRKPDPPQRTVGDAGLAERACQAERAWADCSCYGGVIFPSQAEVAFLQRTDSHRVSSWPVRRLVGA